MELFEDTAALLGFGLAASFAPVLYSAAVLSLSHRRRPLWRTAPLVLGVTAAHALIAALLVGTLFIPLLRDSAHRAAVVGRGALGLGRDLLITFDPIVSILLVGLGIAAITWWRVADYPLARPSLHTRVSGRGLFAFGFVRSLLHAVGIASLALAVRVAARYGLFTPLLMLGVVLAGALPYAAIFAVRRLSPSLFGRLRHILEKLSALDPRLLAGILLLAVGAYFGYQAIVQ